MTGYPREEVICNTADWLLERLFKRGINFCNLDRSDSHNFFMFTASNDVKQVRVLKWHGPVDDETILVFYEKPNSRLEHKYPFLDQLLSNKTTGVAVYGIPGLILLKANQRYLSYLEEPYNKIEACIGKEIGKIIPGWEESTIKKVWQEAEKNLKPVQLNETSYNGFKRGVTYWDGIIVPLCEGREVKYIVMSINEVTDRVNNRRLMERRIKDLIKQKEELEKRLNLKDEFFNYISHEFKTPITVINAAIQAMELICKDEFSDKAKKFINQIKQNSMRQLRLVNNLLDITRVESGYVKVHKKNMDIVAVTKAITESVSLYAGEKEEELVFESSLSEKIIALDDEKYERILLNLLSNAIKFSPKGKTITVRLSMKKGKVCVQVIDEGVGIPKEKQKLIFERFGQVDSQLTKNQEGTGIGLCLVKLLVNALGGEISLSSEEGKGSTFTVLLPDTKVADDEKAETQDDIENDKLVQAVALEFSDIYFSS